MLAVSSSSVPVPFKGGTLVADADGNGLLDERDFALLRAKVGGTFASLGNGLAGTHGLPTLTGDGPLTANSVATFTVGNALENANGWTVYGLGISGGKLKGGTLVPSPDFFLGPFSTGPIGGFALPAIRPALPAGLAIQLPRSRSQPPMASPPWCRSRP